MMDYNKTKCSKESVPSWLAGLFFSFRKSKPKITTAELEKADYKISTQSLGIGFTEHLRNVFRFKWIRRK